MTFSIELQRIIDRFRDKHPHIKHVSWARCLWGEFELHVNDHVFTFDTLNFSPQRLIDMLYMSLEVIEPWRRWSFSTRIGRTKR